MSRVGVPDGESAYFRLTTRVVDPSLSPLPEDPVLLERRRRQSIAGGYRISSHDPATEQVTLVGMGAVLPEVLDAADALAQQGVVAGVVCLTSADLVYRAFDARGRSGTGSILLDGLLPPQHPAPLVTVLDGHPHTLSFLAGARGDRIRCLGVTTFGQSSDLHDAHLVHGLDPASITGAALDLLGR